MKKRILAALVATLMLGSSTVALARDPIIDSSSPTQIIGSTPSSGYLGSPIPESWVITTSSSSQFLYNGVYYNKADFYYVNGYYYPKGSYYYYNGVLYPATPGTGYYYGGQYYPYYYPNGNPYYPTPYPYAYPTVQYPGQSDSLGGLTIPRNSMTQMIVNQRLYDVSMITGYDATLQNAITRLDFVEGLARSIENDLTVVLQPSIDDSKNIGISGTMDSFSALKDIGAKQLAFSDKNNNFTVYFTLSDWVSELRKALEVKGIPERNQQVVLECKEADSKKLPDAAKTNYQKQSPNSTMFELRVYTIYKGKRVDLSEKAPTVYVKVRASDNSKARLTYLDMKTNKFVAAKRTISSLETTNNVASSSGEIPVGTYFFVNKTQ